jgi:hypothetical protein
MTVCTPDTYFASVQYNWTGQYDKEGKKIPGDIPECVVRGLCHPMNPQAATHTLPFSMIDARIVKGHHLNPVRFKTITNIAHVISGTGVFRVYDEAGFKDVTIQPEVTITIPPKTKYSFISSDNGDLKLIMVSSPPWFQEDEEYDWELVRDTVPTKEIDL